MDLRKRAGYLQQAIETVIRLRLPLLLGLGLGWWFGAASWREFVGMVLNQAHRNSTIVTTLVSGHFGNVMDWLRFGFSVALLFLVRGRLQGWRSGVLTLWVMLGVILGCLLLDGTAAFLPAILSAVLVILVTLLFFGRSVWFIGGLAFAACIYLLAMWNFGVAVHNGMGWQILVAMTSADLALLLASIRTQLKSGHTKAGAIVNAEIKVALGTLGTAILLFTVDLVCYYLKIPSLQGGSLVSSALSYFAYILVVLVLAPILFSFSPFGRIQAKTRTMSKS